MYTFVRVSRWDVCSAVSSVSRFDCSSVKGIVTSLRGIAGYLKGLMDFELGDSRLPNVDAHIGVSVNSNRHGDKIMTAKT